MIVGSVCVIVFMLKRQLLSYEGSAIFQHKASRKILSDGETRYKIWKDGPAKKLPFFHLHSACEADIW